MRPSRIPTAKGLPMMADLSFLPNRIRKRIAVLIGIVILIAGCGGGGGGTSATVPANSSAPGTIFFGSATLSWLPPTANTDGSPLTDLAGYVIYWGKSPYSLKNSVRIHNAGLSVYLIEPLEPATWFFSTAAFNADGLESEPSNLVAKVIE